MERVARGLGIAALVVATGMSQGSPELETPTRIKAGDAFIDVITGHASPLMRDMDGDGLKDLLVGEFGTGRFPEAEFLTAESKKYATVMCHSKVRVYKNVGTKNAPQFDKFEYLKIIGGDASIPMT